MPLRTSCSATAVRFRASTATVSPRGELLPKMFGPEMMQVFREFKTIWDPDWKMNPGKVIDAYRADENLRYESTIVHRNFKPILDFPVTIGEASRARPSVASALGNAGARL